jgi:hypothetical protein
MNKLVRCTEIKYPKLFFKYNIMKYNIIVVVTDHMLFCL